MLAAAGSAVTLVCATNGDVGEISDPALATPETLGQVRQQELRDAMAVTGVRDVRFLGYRDSGMHGTDDNNHPSSLYQASADEVAGALVEIIREVRPNVVITHDPSGGYGHPDHIAVQQRMTQAFKASGDPAWQSASPDSSRDSVRPPWAADLLYYVCYPRSNFRRMWQQMVDNGVTPPFASLEVDKIGSPDEEVTTTVDVSNYVETKIASPGLPPHTNGPHRALRSIAGGLDAGDHEHRVLYPGAAPGRRPRFRCSGAPHAKGVSNACRRDKPRSLQEYVYLGG